MAIPFRRNYDMTLTVDSKDYGYMLYVDQYGQKHWGEGLAPLITPQQRITEFSYEHIPPEIDMPAAFEDWTHGAGHTEFTALGHNSPFQNASNVPTAYEYSQGIDASWGNRLYLSPGRVADNASTGGAIAAAPSFFFDSTTFGLWCIASQYMYKYDLTSGTWVLRNTASAAVRSMAELNGVLYASVTNAAYIFSTNSDTWTAFSDANLNSANIADLFVVRNNVLMAMRSEKAYVTTNGQNGGTAWSAGTSIGSSSESTKSLAVANGSYWIIKLEGVYKWDGTTVTDIWHPKYLTNTNGKYAFVWYDGLIYTTFDTNILVIDPFNTDSAIISFAYPPQKGHDGRDLSPHDSTEIKGTISQISGTFHDLFFSVTNPDGRTYLMKGDPTSGVFHTYAYLGSNTNNATIVAGPGVMHATNPCLATGYGTAAIHYILPQADLRPEDDTNYLLETSGTIYGPWLSFGARAFNKYLNRGTILAAYATAGNNITLSYQLDDDSTTTLLVTGADTGLSFANVSAAVSFNRIRYVITMTSQDNATTPIMAGATFHSTLNPPRRRVWKPIVSLSPNLILRDGMPDNQDPDVLRSALFAAAASRITMTDRNNQSYTVRLLDIQEVQLRPYAEGSDEQDTQILQLSLAEISPLSTSVVAAYYGQAAYGQSYVYS